MWKRILVMALIAESASADFSGFPLASNEYNWAVTRTNIAPFGQLYSSIVERCEVTGIAVPSNEVTYACYAGTTVVEVISNGFTYQNVIIGYTNVTTNTINPFTYTYTQSGATLTATGYPFITAGFMAKLDAKIRELAPHFAQTNYAGTDWYSNYFANTDGSTRPTNFPTHTFASLCKQEGVGYVTNYGTNAYGYPTSGVSWFTYEPASTQNITLAENRDTNGVNYFNDIGTIGTNYFEAVYPTVRYYTNGPNPIIACDIVISGTVMSNGYPQTYYSSAETVSVANVYNPCTQLWQDVTGITLTNKLANTGDVLAVMFTNRFVLYKDSQVRIFARDLDERWKVLRKMLWSVNTYDPGTTPLANGEEYYKTTYWTNAAGDETGWDNSRTALSNSLADSASWTNDGSLPSEFIYFSAGHKWFGPPSSHYRISGYEGVFNATYDYMIRGSYVFSVTSTNYSKESRIYMAATNKSEDLGGNTIVYFDMLGKFPNPGFYYLWDTQTNVQPNVTGALMNANSSISIPADIDTTDTVRGQGFDYQGLPFYMLNRWDITNGFKFK